MPPTLQSSVRPRAATKSPNERANRRNERARPEQGKPEPITVAVADGHELVRSGMERLLFEADGVEVVATSADLEEALRHLRGHRPDVFVYDPTGDSKAAVDADTVQALESASPETAVVIVCPFGGPDEARAALRSGAVGFVAKDEPPAALLEAVRSAAVGEPYINGRLAIDIARLEAAEEADGLTERELEILRLIALGHTNGEIADMLFLSIRTVESHRAHILEKLRLTKRSELVHYAIDKRLIP